MPSMWCTEVSIQESTEGFCLRKGGSEKELVLNEVAAVQQEVFFGV